MVILSFSNLFYINILLLFIFGFFLIIIGIYGFLQIKNNLILFLICNEVFLLGLIFSFISFSELNNDLYGQIFAIVILVISAVETAIILIIFLLTYKYFEIWDLNLFNFILKKK